ncbi:hypothetical protein AALO_G00173030 [Alosa alosa]|uniref:Protein S100 n=2 Tax=Alosa alosa TaxID=278164 RepID=A0AAV6G725_9TELE|nr:hypothetical protein AALO_G00173030 [Alosa alosa]
MVNTAGRIIGASPSLKDIYTTHLTRQGDQNSPPAKHTSVPRTAISLVLSAIMPSDLETSMETLIKVFHKYASREGDSGTLSRKELRTLMEAELAGFLRSQKDPGAVDRIMKDLDTNGDGEVNFEEFVSLVVGLSIACEQCFQLHMKKGKK